MAHDGFLPTVLKGKEGKPPVGAILLQGVMPYFGFSSLPTLNLWVGICILTALMGYFIAKRKRTKT